MAGLCERASRRSELVGVIAVRVDDLEQISTAFGSEVARAVSRDLAPRGAAPRALERPRRRRRSDRAAGGRARRTQRAEARRQAALIYRGLFEDLGRVGGGVIPVVGVGVGLSDATGYDAAALTSVAREAASRAATSVETSVLVGDDE